MHEKLKPCPFCGAPAKIAYFDSAETLSFTYTHVVCDNPDCWVQPESAGFIDEQSAVKAWNRRAEVKNND